MEELALDRFSGYSCSDIDMMWILPSRYDVSIQRHGILYLDTPSCPPAFAFVKVEPEAPDEIKCLSLSHREEVFLDVTKVQKLGMEIAEEQRLLGAQNYVSGEMHGPAFQTLFCDGGECDNVVTFACKESFPVMADFHTRERCPKWLETFPLDYLCQMPGLLVATGHKRSPEEQRRMQFRMSFSAQEIIMLRAVPSWLRQAGVAFKFILRKASVEWKSDGLTEAETKSHFDISTVSRFANGLMTNTFTAFTLSNLKRVVLGTLSLITNFVTTLKTRVNTASSGRSDDRARHTASEGSHGGYCEESSGELCTYHFKTTFLWTLENMSQEDWEKGSTRNILCRLIDNFIDFLEIGFLPNYWIPECNLLETISKRTLTKGIEVLRNKRNHLIDIILLAPTFPGLANAYETNVILDVFHSVKVAQRVSDDLKYKLHTIPMCSVTLNVQNLLLNSGGRAHYLLQAEKMFVSHATIWPQVMGEKPTVLRYFMCAALTVTIFLKIAFENSSVRANGKFLW